MSEIWDGPGDDWYPGDDDEDEPLIKGDGTGFGTTWGKRWTETDQDLCSG